MSTNLGQSAAIDPATGETLWVYRALDDGAGRPRGGSTRGVGYWHDPGLDDEAHLRRERRATRGA